MRASEGAVKIYFFLLLMLPLCCSPLVALADPPAGYDFIGYDEGVTQAKASGKPIFLYYGRYGCGYCDKTNKETFSDPGVAKLFKDNYVLVYVDAEGADRLTLPSGEVITEQLFGARLNSLVTPYFMVLKSDGTPIVKIPGYKNIKDMTALHHYAAEGYYKEMPFSEFTKK